MELERILAKLPDEERALIMEYIEKDPLTGAYNKRRFEQDVNIEVMKTERTGRDVSLLIIDIDYFKHYNDTYGHPAGDGLLREMVTCLRGSLRAYNQEVYRIGGEEFAILIPETELNEGRVIGERLRQSVEESGLGVTVSIGVANYKCCCNTKDELVEFADQALYKAKKTGRDKVVVYSSSVNRPNLHQIPLFE